MFSTLETASEVMPLRSRGRWALPFTVIFVACGSNSTLSVKGATPAEDRFTPDVTVSDEQGMNSESAADTTVKSSGVPSWLVDERRGSAATSLPRLSFRHLGMHIGGEANDSEAKKPWFVDIEGASRAILGCYTRVPNALAGGSYGIDLYVGRGGGSPEIKGSRQKIGGVDFDDCMQDAFRSISFHRPERPTVLSYSLIFQLGSDS